MDTLGLVSSSASSSTPSTAVPGYNIGAAQGYNGYSAGSLPYSFPTNNQHATPPLPPRPGASSAVVFQCEGHQFCLSDTEWDLCLKQRALLQLWDNVMDHHLRAIDHSQRWDGIRQMLQ